jgi:hypothetical protein
VIGRLESLRDDKPGSKIDPLKPRPLSGKVRGRVHARSEGVPHTSSRKMRCFIVMMIGLMGISPAAAERIVNDGGGRIEEYVAKFTRARDAGE